MKIGNFDLARSVFVIAEIGNNHEGDFGRAKEMVQAAAACKVNAVKFQTIRPEHFVSRKNEQRFKQLKSYEFNADQIAELATLARKLQVEFLSTPFDLGAVDLLNPLVPAFKIASGDNNFLPLLQKVAATNKPILLSTGLATVADIRIASKTVEQVWQKMGIKPGLVVLHCTCAYPTPPEQANLRAIEELSKELPYMIGYSDHTLGIDAACAAVALGARVIEKHFTLNKNQSSFRDHQLSADPADMTEMVARIRSYETLLGSSNKVVQPAEEQNVTAARRSIVAAQDLKAGTVLTIEHLSWMRPGNGIRPGEEALVLGKTLKCDLGHGDLFTTDILA
jgi:N,N'-diacetyllegionaminate synthase